MFSSSKLVEKVSGFGSSAPAIQERGNSEEEEERGSWDFFFR